MMWREALACAAMIMDAEGSPLPQATLIDAAPAPAACLHSTRPEGCGALLYPWPPRPGEKSGRIFLVMPADVPFDLQVHEAAHVIQLARGQQPNTPAGEAEAETVAAEAWRCTAPPLQEAHKR
jgi:hypothetical protein